MELFTAITITEKQKQMEAGFIYIINDVALCNLILPPKAAEGSYIEIFSARASKKKNHFRIIPNENQYILMGNVKTLVGKESFIQSTRKGDGLLLRRSYHDENCWECEAMLGDFIIK